MANMLKQVKLGFTKTTRGKKALDKTGLMMVGSLAGLAGAGWGDHLVRMVVSYTKNSQM